MVLGASSCPLFLFLDLAPQPLPPLSPLSPPLPFPLPPPSPLLSLSPSLEPPHDQEPFKAFISLVPYPIRF